MKDAQGHGSDSRGMANRQTAGNHQSGVLRIGRGAQVLRIQEQVNPYMLGQPHYYQTVGTSDASRSLVNSGRARAERMAMQMSQDRRRLTPLGTPYKFKVR